MKGTIATACAALACLGAAFGAVGTSAAGAAATPPAEAPPTETRLIYAPGKIVPIPESIPHEAGDMVDRRILPDLLWLSRNYGIYVTDGYSGPLPDGRHAGCDNCHVRGSDHYNGLAVDIVPADPSARCDGKWSAITQLARWAEPIQNRPVPPFRWVGYDGDAGHGCGHHLHLSWNHALAKQFELAEWVEVFSATTVAGKKRGKPATQATKVPKAPAGPPGGLGGARTGGLSPRGTGD